MSSRDSAVDKNKGSAMYKTVACWSAPKPEDQQAFEDIYWSEHVAAAQRVPFLRRLVLTRIGGGVGGQPAAFYRVAELWFDDRAQFEEATRTKEWADLRAHGERIRERFGVTLASGHGSPIEAEPVGSVQ